MSDNGVIGRILQQFKDISGSTEQQRPEARSRSDRPSQNKASQPSSREEALTHAKVYQEKLSKQGLDKTEIKRRINRQSQDDFRESPGLLDDIPTLSDNLGFAPVATLIGDLLVDVHTATPFAIGIDGAWGSGKTS